MSARGYWIAFGVGVAAGAAVALLYAPQSGAKTRKKLKRGINDAGEYLNDAGDYLKDQAERLSHEAQAVYRKSMKEAGEYVDSARKIAESVPKMASKLM